MQMYPNKGAWRHKPLPPIRERCGGDCSSRSSAPSPAAPSRRDSPHHPPQHGECGPGGGHGGGGGGRPAPPAVPPQHRARWSRRDAPPPSRRDLGQRYRPLPGAAAPPSRCAPLPSPPPPAPGRLSPPPPPTPPPAQRGGALGTQGVTSLAGSGGRGWTGTAAEGGGARRVGATAGRSGAFGGALPAAAPAPSGLAAGSGCGGPVPSVPSRGGLPAAERAGDALGSGQWPLPSPGARAVYI